MVGTNPTRAPALRAAELVSGTPHLNPVWDPERSRLLVVFGSNPVVSPNGQPNVTWILRWKDRATREVEFARAFGSDGWREVWRKHPNPNAYLHMNARFFERLVP